VSTWKRQAIEGLFSDKVKKAENKQGEIKGLHVPLTVSGLPASNER